MKFYWARFFEEDNGGYSVDVPDLPGCLTCGDSFEDAYRYLVEEAMPLWLEGQEGPAASDPKAVLAAPTYEGAPQPILVLAAAGGPALLAEALTRADGSEVLAQAARAYLARHQDYDHA